MPAVTLPMTFANSFWSQDYRRGLETLYAKLDEGLAENVEIFNFIKARALAENALALALMNAESIVPQESGFGVDDGATLLATFRSLQAESRKQGEGHKTAAQELVTLVADPFGTWASKHATRITASKKDLLEGWIRAYEQATAEVDKLKLAYINKTRRADEIEDNVKFAPGRDIGDPYTLSPSLAPTNRRSAAFARTASVSERIAQRFKELRKGIELQDEERKGFLPGSPVFSEKIESEPEGEEKLNATPAIPAKDKGKGKAITSSPQEIASPVSTSPPRLSPPLPELEHPIPNITVRTDTGPPPIIIGGLAFPPQALSRLLQRASAELPLRKVRFPILGEYPDCFSGEEFVIWLKDNVQGFGGKLDVAEQAAIELTENEDALRRIGELGNHFSNARDAYFQFRTKAFEFHLQQDKLDPGALISPVADNLVKRTNTLVSIVQKAVAGGNSEPPHVRARNEAFDAEKIYRVGVRRLDRQRLSLEEKIEDTLKMLQRWEIERLRMIKTVLLQYQGIIANLPGALHSSFERSTVAVASFQPDTDIIALIERYRTGPFRPCPPLFESITHEQQDTIFGVDLRRWAHENASKIPEDQKDAEKLDLVPNIVKNLLQGLAEAYNRLPDDSERRKVWIYDVPLPALHHLREAINTLPPPGVIPMDLLAKYDAPILAGTLKLWLLELNPPLCTWDAWDDLKRIYPQVGSGNKTEEERLQELHAALLRLPKVHLVVLDTIIEHLRTLIDTTATEEPLEIYVTKLGLSLGRCILRSKLETQKSLEDRHPLQFVMELINRYNDLLPKALAAKKRDSGPMLTRKRTKMVDQRVSRSKISAGINPQQLLAAQHAAQHGPSSRTSSPVPGHSNSPSEAPSPLAPEPPSKPMNEAKPEPTPEAPSSSVEPIPESEKVFEQGQGELPKSGGGEMVTENVDDAATAKIAEPADTPSAPLLAPAAEPEIPSPPPPVETPFVPPPPPPPLVPEAMAKPVQLNVPPPPPLVVPAPTPAYQLPPRPRFAEEIEESTKEPENPTPEPVAASQPPRPRFAEEIDEPIRQLEKPAAAPGAESADSPVSAGSITPARQSPDSSGSVESGENKTRGEIDRFGSRTSLRRTGSGTGATGGLVRGARPSSLLARTASGVTSASGTPSTHGKTSSISSGSTSKSPVRRTVNMFNRNASQASSEQAREYAPRKHVGKASAALFSRRTVASDAEDNILDK